MKDNRDRIKATLEWAEKYANGEDVEFFSQYGKWEKVNWWNFETFSDVKEFRIKPTPTLRPWKPEEVPFGAWVKHKDDSSFPSAIIAFTDKKIFTNWNSYLFSDALLNLNCSIDLGKTWKPCGVVEE